MNIVRDYYDVYIPLNTFGSMSTYHQCAIVVAQNKARRFSRQEHWFVIGRPQKVGMTYKFRVGRKRLEAISAGTAVTGFATTV